MFAWFQPGEDAVNLGEDAGDLYVILSAQKYSICIALIMLILWCPMMTVWSSPSLLFFLMTILFGFKLFQCGVENFSKLTNCVFKILSHFHKLKFVLSEYFGNF